MDLRRSCRNLLAQLCSCLLCWGLQDATQQEHQQQSGIAYGDERCGYGKQDEQQPSFSESEAALLTLQPGSDTGCVSRAQLQSWHNRFKGASAAIAGLEQLASAATTQHLDAQGGWVGVTQVVGQQSCSHTLCCMFMCSPPQQAHC